MSGGMRLYAVGYSAGTSRTLLEPNVGCLLIVCCNKEIRKEVTYQSSTEEVNGEFVRLVSAAQWSTLCGTLFLGPAPSTF
jgi:hypothetical protein